ncbi:MAG: family 43 glycosylhydrolase [Pontiellaceae bacterium]|nr:family 43 glycosylhydrolase [Pontiellaceae bacterium]
MMKRLLTLLALCFVGATYAADSNGYLFVTFRGEGSPMTEQIYFMVSENGRDWEALNEGEPVLISTIGEKGVRDPYIIRSHDGKKIYLIATDLSINLNGDWGRAQTAASQSIVIWESEDLVNWSEPRLVKVAPDNAGCTWAPEAVYDEERGEYMVFWASKTADDNFSKQRIWAARTKDFKEFSEPFIYIEKPTTVIDTTIIRENGMYYRFTKDEQYKAITMETSKDLMDGWKSVEDFSLAKLTGYEGPTCFMIEPATDGKPAKWCLLLDWYSRGRGYQPYMTDDLSKGQFTETDAMNFPFHPVRHGTVMPITGDEMSRLVKRWGSIDLEVTSNEVKKINVVIDRDAETIELPVKPGTDLTQLDPGFKTGDELKITPPGPQDFSKGPVKYTFGEDYAFEVSTVENHNPALAGYYADPDVLYSHFTERYYIYPTTDGFDGWSGTYFKAFSSPDLVHWSDECIILDLEEDVEWADRNAWAPCIIEKEIGGEYKYFYYFTAAQKIGVAEADHPAGPFKDSGSALIDFKPEGVSGGQEIDPEVFHDPKSGKDYLYWGNGYLAMAELNYDMKSIKKSTIKVMTPDRTFREGVTVFFRDDVYYFLWSEDDTRSPNYRVRYAVAKSPTGPLTIPRDNLVIARRDSEGIYGTGHNSVIQVPGKDEWYIVYHRFNYPKGITMGDSAGFHREVCIDKMEFDDAGHIIRVTPTHEGIQPVE